MDYIEDLFSKIKYKIKQQVLKDTKNKESELSKDSKLSKMSKLSKISKLSKESELSKDSKYKLTIKDNIKKKILNNIQKNDKDNIFINKSSLEDILKETSVLSPSTYKNIFEDVENNDTDDSDNFYCKKCNKNISESDINLNNNDKLSCMICNNEIETTTIILS